MPSRPRNDHERAPADLVHLHDTTLTTDSRRVAKHFGKRHDNVLRAYDALQCSAEYRRLNFEETIDKVPGPKGATRHERLVRMTKNGFVFLVMGFTGAEAARIKEAYINAFDAMAEELKRHAQHGFLTLLQRRLELEKLDESSFKWASFGSRNMLERQRALPRIRSERQRLEQEMQQRLPLLEGAL